MPQKLTHITLSALLEGLPEGQLFLLTDTNTAKYCLPLFTEFIGETPYHLLEIEPGEHHKNLSTVQMIWDFLFNNRATRQAILINLGGGMLTDIGGFAAATYMRGIRFVNVPTTLLAMVDASSGGKTGIDYQGAKNVIGTFTPPMECLLYPEFLRTLPQEQLLSGMAEMIKHALIASPEQWQQLLQLTDDNAQTADFIEEITTSGLLEANIEIKEKVVAEDPLETGWRKILNFGHTVGHAIESASLENTTLPNTTPHYTTLHHTSPSHGYCVLWGMVAEVYLSVVHAGCPREVLQYLSRIMLMWYGRPECNCKQREELIQRMYQDKKNTANTTPNFTLLKKVGQPMINQHLTERDINEALEYLFSL